MGAERHHLDRQQPHPHGPRASPGRFELRLPDGAANPYLLQAVILAAGMSGMETNADPGPHSDLNMYVDGHRATNTPRLPLNLLDALRALECDETFCMAIGPEFVSSYLKKKREEWTSYASAITQWERDNTLDV
ncbi:Glutamine synthetase, catalytic domain [Fulvimarina manganoxydans]|uniref:Glutamine synthetase, catalytic domain n=1 Tax=Fulvimarina manganoxydans TaxID=937218 RepID=A0A1W2DJG2_9HYPH|nr:Glutamine synthetase, catalytic domain [Fulvimarina manganoxydans]